MRGAAPIRSAVGSLIAGALATWACAGGAAGSGGGDVSLHQRPPSRESAAWAGLRYEIALRPSPLDRLRLRATVTNVSGGFREQLLPFCLIRIRLYRDGRLAWDQAAAEGCGEGVRLLRLRAGESRSFSRTLTAERVLGDSLEPGRYRLRAHLPGSDRPGRPRADMTFELGQVTLERSEGGAARRPPPPATGPGPARAPPRSGRSRPSSR